MHTVSPQEETTILNEIYPKSQIFIKNAEFFPDRPSVVVTCVVAVAEHYTAKPIPYVTTENYVRCLSQASYLLAEHLLKESRLDIDTSLDGFRKAATAYESYYRNLAMTFHKRVSKGESFTLKLSITNAKEIKRLGKDFILFTFANEKTVISGEMSFVYCQ